MSTFALIFALFALIIALLYFLEGKNRRHFESKGIPYRGNGTYIFMSNFITGIGFVDSFTVAYKQMKSLNAKVVGASEFGITKLLVFDPDIIKSVLVKDFDHFVDRGTFFIPKNDYLFAKMLLTLKGDQWKLLRSKLSPTFTTGKIKRLFTLFDQSGKKFVKFIEDETTTNNEMDLSSAYSKFAMDVIASAVCAMDSQAFEQKEPSVFEKMGNKLRLNFGGKGMINMLVIMLAPPVADFLGLSVFNMEMQEFFSTAIKGSIHDRQAKNEKGNDFIQLMLEAREDKLKTEEGELSTFEKDAQIKSDIKRQVSTGDMLDDTGVVANCVLFVLAGFDTTQSLMLFCAYALALNQNVQDRLREEVEAALEDNGGEFSYESIHKMTYLDMVINETLRVYPPAGLTERTATQDYKVPGTDYVLKKGCAVQIPIAGLHQDPQYFPEPEKFDPERFSAENKSKINQYAYLPFGAGPRNCIGMRFALTEAKVAISHLVHNFRIEPSKKTLIPMKYTNENSLKPKGGMFLALNKIHH